MIFINAKTTVKIILINWMENRTMTYLRKLLKENRCDRLPKVNVHFDRRENQEKESRGNRFNIREGFNTKYISLINLLKIVCSNPDFIFHDDYENSYPRLLQKGLVPCSVQCEFI